MYKNNFSPSFSKEILIWNIWFQEILHKQQAIFNNNTWTKPKQQNLLKMFVSGA